MIIKGSGNQVFLSGFLKKCNASKEIVLSYTVIQHASDLFRIKVRMNKLMGNFNREQTKWSFVFGLWLGEGGKLACGSLPCIW